MNFAVDLVQLAPALNHEARKESYREYPNSS